MKKFTIAIPTRNRSSLLVHALKAALSQDFDDYEILVSNNCSEDCTESVVLNMKDPRIRYIKTDGPMNMVDHWNFVLDHVQGEWVFYLCDDDAVSPLMLSYVDGMISKYDNIDIFQMRNSTYTYSDMNCADANVLKISREYLIKEAELVDSAEALISVYRNMGGALPLIQTSVISVALLGKIKAKYGKAFFPWAPDYTNAILLLANSEKYLRLYKPLYISGQNRHSYGSGSRVDPNKLKEFFSEFEGFNGSFSYSPYPELLTVDNAIYETFSMLHDKYFKDRLNLSIDPYIFRKGVIAEIEKYMKSGYHEYRNYLQQISNDINHYPRNFNLLFQIKVIVNPAIRSVFKSTIGLKIIDGNRTVPKFSNIFEAAKFLGQNYA